MTRPHMGALVGTESQVSGGTIAAILPTEQTQRKLNWQRLVRALRSEDDWRLLNQHRARLARHLGSNVVFLGGGR